MQIFHIATRDDWEAAQRSGFYTTSTIGVTLQDEGFIHTSRADQVSGVYARYYAAVADPLVLLIIDTELLTVPWREDEVGSDTYPHVYGPLNPGAVVGTVPVANTLGAVPTHDVDATVVQLTEAAVRQPPVTPTAGPAQKAPAEDFGRVFLRDVLTRIAFAFGIMAMITICVLATQAINSDYSWVGILVGVALSFAAGTVIKRRRGPITE